MKLIVKDPPPASFVNYCQKPIGVSFDEMDGAVKDDLKQALLKEQGWICGYCQQKIKDETKMKVEHHCEQSICNGADGYPDRRLDYKNLMAVCLGKGSYSTHCDTQKATFNLGNGLPINISPWVGPHMTGISYAPTGKIHSGNPIHSREIETILNLNAGHLKEIRKNLYMRIFSLSSDKKGGINRDKMRKLTTEQSKKSGDYYTVPFPGLYEYLLNKYC